jgi:hypothetical protein
VTEQANLEYKSKQWQWRWAKCLQRSRMGGL